MKKGLEVLKARKRNVKQVDLIPLPPMYSLFTSYFELGEDGFTYDKYYLASKDKMYHS